MLTHSLHSVTSQEPMLVATTSYCRRPAVTPARQGRLPTDRVTEQSALKRQRNIAPRCLRPSVTPSADDEHGEAPDHALRGLYSGCPLTCRARVTSWLAISGPRSQRTGPTSSAGRRQNSWSEKNEGVEKRCTRYQRRETQNTISLGVRARDKEEVPDEVAWRTDPTSSERDTAGRRRRVCRTN